MKTRLISLSNAYLPPLLWALFIYLLSGQSSLPGFETSAYDFFFKKCAHMFVYAVFYFLLYRGVNLQNQEAEKKTFIPFIIVFGYACLDELHQSFTPGRSPTFRDIGYDLLGAAIAFLKVRNFI